MKFLHYSFAFAGLFCLLPACSSDSTMATTESDSLGGKNPDGKAGDDQTPPSTNAADVEAWLAKGSYKAWNCETSSHPQMKVSPHGQNKICSNDLTAKFAGAVADERPVGSAAVKELYDDSMALVGYAVYVKTKATSDHGNNWYWYERVPLASAVPHNSAGVVADGIRTEGQALAICVGCHSAAGSNSDHTVLGSSDFVYDQISTAK